MVPCPRRQNSSTVQFFVCDSLHNTSSSSQFCPALLRERHQNSASLPRFRNRTSVTHMFSTHRSRSSSSIQHSRDSTTLFASAAARKWNGTRKIHRKNQIYVFHHQPHQHHQPPTTTTPRSSSVPAQGITTTTPVLENIKYFPLQLHSLQTPTTFGRSATEDIVALHQNAIPPTADPPLRMFRILSHISCHFTALLGHDGGFYPSNYAPLRAFSSHFHRSLCHYPS